MIEHFLSSTIFSNMSAADAVSLDVNDISLIAFINSVESIFLISMCLTTSFNKSFLFIFSFFLKYFCKDNTKRSHNEHYFINFYIFLFFFVPIYFFRTNFSFLILDKTYIF